ALPTSGAPNVIYLINPKTGETIAPWDPNNIYRDTELCQERILGLSPTTGPCGPSDLPAGSTWYRVVDDTLSSSDIWQTGTGNSLNNPLDFKWVRITLKANNNTPVAANGVNTDSHQVGGEGEGKLLLPAGYGPDCMRYGSVVMVPPTSSGTGYDATGPTVTIDPPPLGGTQATATPVMELVDAVVGTISVTPGSNY